MAQKVIRYYKIRRKSDGLFSTGGENPEFEITGKTWKNIGHIKSHMKQSSKPENSVRALYYQPEDNFEVIEVEYVEISGRTIPLKDFK